MGIKVPKKPTKSTRKASAKPKRDAQSVASERVSNAYEHIAIADLDVILLQTDANGSLDIEDVVFAVFDAEADRRRAGTAWLAFRRSGMTHYMGKHDWIGLSKSVPLPVVDTIQAVLKAAEIDVERAMGRALHLDLNPFARLSDDGLELLVPAALVGDPTARRVVDRGVDVIARGYTLGTSKAASLEALLLGD